MASGASSLTCTGRAFFLVVTSFFLLVCGATAQQTSTAQAAQSTQSGEVTARPPQTGQATVTVIETPTNPAPPQASAANSPKDAPNSSGTVKLGPGDLIELLVDIVSKNGNLLVNIGPRSDGTIPQEVQDVLREVGSWLKINGEAIYGTRPWKIYGEGPTKIVEGAFHDTDAQPFTEHDFRFTTKGAAVYACQLGWPVNGQALIHSLTAEQLGGRKIISVALLGATTRLSFASESSGLQIKLPAQGPGKYAHCFKITLDVMRP